MSFTGLIRQILESNREGMTPQQIRDTIKADHPEFYGTDSHIRNVTKGHYKDLDHALLAQIYSASRTGRQIRVDRTRKPVRLTIGGSRYDNYADHNKRITGKPGREQRSARSMIANTRAATPSPSLISEYWCKWAKLESYRLQESSLELLFHTLCPENTEIEHVLLKVSALNDFYSTRIYDTYSVAKHILDKNIDNRLNQNDRSLVNDLALVSMRGKTINFYSFASKYCSHHKPAQYPVFDSFVEKMLLYYRNSDRFMKFSREDLKIYVRFIEIIQAFQSFYALGDFSLREIDVFLWLAGKEYFPRKYK